MGIHVDRSAHITAFRLLFSLIGFLLFFTATGQRYFQIEKHHTRIKLKYTTGDDVTFRLRQSDQWITSTLGEIDYDNNILFFTNLTVPLDSINAIKSHRPLVSPGLGKTLWRSGIAGLGTSLLYTLAFQPANAREFLLFFGGVSATGLGLQQLSKIRRIYPIGKKYNLRLTDLNVYIPHIVPASGS